jgi:hypothetical protein
MMSPIKKIVSAGFVFLAALFTLGCDPRTVGQEADPIDELRRTAQRLAEARASAAECQEALGKPDWESRDGDWIVWRYRLSKPTDSPDNWLTLTFSAETGELSNISTLYVDSFPTPEPKAASVPGETKLTK